MSFSEEQLESARKVFSGQIAFLKPAPSLEFLPEPTVNEVAFAGRSNVGKSSLLNALTNRSSLARTSNTPGRTQELNFFDVGNPVQFRLVDMPGYGFAEAPKDKVAAWNKVLRGYLAGRRTLLRVFVLIDARHGIKAADNDILALLDSAAVSYQGVLTKADKVSHAELEKVAQATRQALGKHPAAYPGIIVTSSEKNLGIDILRGTIARLLIENS